MAAGANGVVVGDVAWLATGRTRNQELEKKTTHESLT